MSRLALLICSTSLTISTRASPSPSPPPGQLDLSLTGTAASGRAYRLRNAELTIRGAAAPIVLHTEDDPAGTVIDQALDAGDYNLGVTPGCPASGAFRFPTEVTGGAAYTVTIAAQPAGQTCTVTGGTGTATSSVTSGAVARAASDTWSTAPRSSAAGATGSSPGACSARLRARRDHRVRTITRCHSHEPTTRCAASRSC